MERFQLDRNTLIKIAVLLLVAILSFFVVAKFAGDVSSYGKTIETLDSKRETVLALAASATAASVAITAIPGDVATPIAEKLSDLSGYFLLILAVLYLEKYLLIIIGGLSFKILIPIGCLLIISTFFIESKQIEQFAKKIIVLGIAIFLVIPTSTWISNKIDQTYEESVQATIVETDAISAEIEEATSAEGDTSSEELSGFSEFWNSAKETIENATGTLVDSVTISVDYLKSLLNRFIEAIAIMLVTSCVIPILVILFFNWLIKAIVGLELPTAKILRTRKTVNKE